MAMPRLPKRRPSSPLRSTNPRCSRAGTVTVTRATRASAFALPAKAGPTIMAWSMRSRPHDVKRRVVWGRKDVVIMAEKERVYSDAEVEARLKQELPHWILEKGWIRRKYKTHSWKGTLMVVNTVGHLAEAAWHHPDITASYAWVEVRLMNHAAKGITDKDFELAKKIEDVIHWQPGKAGGALEGTPATDQRFAYIKYDA